MPDPMKCPVLVTVLSFSPIPAKKKKNWMCPDLVVVVCGRRLTR